MPFDCVAEAESLAKPVVALTTKHKPRILLIGSAGYIGSYLDQSLKESGYEIDTCDYLARGLPNLLIPLFPTSHTNITNQLIREYDTVLWFAGQASVKAAESDPQLALKDNCLDLAHLRRRMKPNARLIYASSASLYSQPLDFTGEPPWSEEEDQISHGITAYDRSKACMDALTLGFFNNTVALRMGTLCGFSPNLRPELVFNAMCLSALQDREVRVSNPNAWRSILFLPDLAATVKACIETENPPTILNVASLSLTMELLAQKIAKFFRATVEIGEPGPTYNFRMRTNKMLELLPYSPTATRLESHISHFTESVKQHADRIGIKL